MITYLSVMAAVLALTTASPAVTTPSTPSPSSAPAPSTPSLIPLPPFSGTFANIYPAQNEIPHTDTDLVKKWMSELNTTAIESFPVVPFTAGGDPQNPKAVPEAACDWTITNCINKDLTTCPLGVWGLTYDDGPTEFSGPLYDALDETDQKATLFYIGSNVVQNWQLARRACAAGHHIAVHTWSHHPSTSLTNEQFVAEVKYTEMAIQELCGFTPKYFRVGEYSFCLKVLTQQFKNDLQRELIIWPPPFFLFPLLCSHLMVMWTTVSEVFSGRWVIPMSSGITIPTTGSFPLVAP
jgi:hypothetical protein